MWPGCEADHSLPSSDMVKNVWSYISTLPYVFKVWCLFKHRVNFTLIHIMVSWYDKLQAMTGIMFCNIILYIYP
jgi:hypothetical protein